jgi:muramoyltetrapeptide carboxypeptidase
MGLIIPDRLKEGDTIGFVSPSAGLAPFAMHRIERAMKLFNKLGYKIKIGKSALKNNGYTSASISERVRDIQDMFKDKKVKMIIATIGGNHSNQFLKHIDYKIIKNNPKIFIGYSDSTVLHYVFQSQANLATYYGPCVMTQFGEYPAIIDYTLEYFNRAISEVKFTPSYEIEPSKLWTEEFLDWFQKEDEKRPRKLKRNLGYEWFAEGCAEGELLGGAIPSVNHLIGTKYWRDPRGKIFFIDIPEGNLPSEGLSPSELDSFLADLDNIGLFDSIEGLIIGRPFNYSSTHIEELKKIILTYAGKKKYPILYNANIGHADPVVTIRFGSRVRLDSSQNSFRIIS